MLLKQGLAPGPGAAAEGFFTDVRDTKSTPKNTYNMDELRRDLRLGFTMSATTSADGEVIAKVQEHPRIWQDHQPNSHFQNAETFERWFKKFLPIAVARRGEEDCPITLILDAAGQHCTDSVKALMEQHNVVVVGIA